RPEKRWQKRRSPLPMLRPGLLPHRSFGSHNRVENLDSGSREKTRLAIGPGKRDRFGSDSNLRFFGDSRYRFPECFFLWRHLRPGSLLGLLTDTVFIIQARETSLGSFRVGFHPLDGFLGVFA